MKIIKGIFISLFCLIFMCGCSMFLPIINDITTSDDSSIENKSVCQYVTSSINSKNSNSTIQLSTNIQNFKDAKNSTVRIAACYSLNDSEYEMSTSGFIVDKKYSEETRKYTYYLVTSASGIFYRYISNISTIFNVDTDVTILRSGNFEVTMEDGHIYIGEVVGYFDPYDICIFKFQTENVYDVLEFADSSNMSVGDSVYMYGTPVNGYNLLNTLLKGEISGLDRLTDVYFTETYNNQTYGDSIATYPCFQIDASVNGGMEGGPIVDANGKVLGMIGYRYGTTTGDYSYESISFGIESNNLIPIINSIINTGSFTKNLLGISVTDIYNISTESSYSWISENNITSGVVVVDVSSGSFANKIGLSSNIVITSIENDSKVYQITNLSSLYSCLVQIDSTKDLKITYYDNSNNEVSKVGNFND